MYTIKKMQTRKAVDILFYFEKYSLSQDYKDYVYNKFIEPKKLLFSTIVYSDDKLSMTKTTVWSSRDAFLEFISDKYCYNTAIDPVREYDIENEITADIEMIED